jgi:hypothetical protein
MDARQRAQAEYDLQEKIKAALSPEDFEVYAAMRDRANRWADYQTAVIGYVEFALTTEESVASIRAKLKEYDRACQRLNETLDADRAIPAV